jgi:hypothetical protein
MTSRIFNLILLAVALTVATPCVSNAQDAQMGQLIGQSMAKVDASDPATFLTCISELKRIDAMYPEAAAPKYYAALQSLNYSVLNPHAEATEGLLADAATLIAALEKCKDADASNLHTLKGFLYMVRIVQDPAQNGRRYYLDVMANYEKALKINPDNELARDLQQKFFDGMSQATQN